MNRRLVLAFLAAGALPVATARAQTRPRRVGVLSIGSEPDQSTLRAFRDRLRALGYVEGQTIELHYGFAEGRAERFPDLARLLVALQVEVIVAGGAAISPARAATATIPIVMCPVGDPVESGWARNLARPGGNMTGIASMAPDLVGKLVELLHELLPAARRVAALVNAANASVPLFNSNAVAAGRSVGVEVVPFGVARPEELEPTMARIGDLRPDAMLVMIDSFMFFHRAAVIEFAARARLPAIYSWEGLVRDGGLMSYASDARVYYPRAADYVDKILRGANPAELPIEQPTAFALAVNLRAARAIGLEVPRAILDRADEIVE
jgi:putative ABC transport system substrate-binding protein